MNGESLFQAVEQRRLQRDEIRKTINEYCLNEYGIHEFFSILDEHLLSKLRQDRLNMCLVRQIPCQNIEHLAVSRLVKYLQKCGHSASLASISFVRDSYLSKNEYKKSLLNLPILGRSRNGLLTVNFENILNVRHRSNVEGRIFDEFRVVDGGKLVDYHLELRRKIFGSEDIVVDLSSFFKELAFQSVNNAGKKHPKCLYVRQGTREVKNYYTMVDFLQGSDDPRPPADWYYFFYLLMFVDGTCSMVSTMDKDPIVVSWFKRNIEIINEICGCPPLIVDIPLEVSVDGFSSKLNEVPRWTIDNDVWHESIVIPEEDNCDLCEVVRLFCEQLIVNC